MSPGPSGSRLGAPAAGAIPSAPGSNTTARPPEAAATCSAKAVAVSSRVAAADSLRLKARSEAMAEARREVASAPSRTCPARPPVARAAPQKTSKVSTSAGEVMAKLRRGSRKKKL